MVNVFLWVHALSYDTYIGAIFFMGLKIAELGKFSLLILSIINRTTVCTLIPEKYYTY
jgi:hypothetical protein